MGANPNIHIGEQYGIYMLIDLLPEKDKYGHYVYVGECAECGFLKQSTLSDFKRKNTQQCSHFGDLMPDQIDAWYEKNKIQCIQCGNYIPLGNCNFSEYRRRMFCGQSCSTSHSNRLRESKKKAKTRQCANCLTEVNARSVYCSPQCHSEFRYKQYIEMWKNGEVSGLTGKYQIASYIRRYLFVKYNNKCSQCGWGQVNPFTGKVPLEVHHTDGDYTNNEEGNLVLLCPNCHALTPTYKALNMGNGRSDRRQYSTNIS